MVVCTKCKLDLPRSNFSRRTALKSGLQCYCNSCIKKVTSENEKKRTITPEVYTPRVILTLFDDKEKNPYLYRSSRQESDDGNKDVH